MRIVDQSRKHLPVRLDAVGEWVVADDLARHRGIFLAEEKPGRNAVDHFLRRERLGLNEAVEEIDRNPRVLAIDRTADDIGVVRGQETVRMEEALGLGDLIGKQQLNPAPIAAAGNAPRAVDEAFGARPRSDDGCRIELTREQHRREALVGWDALERDARRGLKTGRAAVAQL